MQFDFADAIIPIYIRTKHDLCVRSTFQIDKRSAHVESMLYWRLDPTLGCEFCYVNAVTKPSKIAENSFQLIISMKDFKLIIETTNDATGDVANTMFSKLAEGIRKSQQVKAWERDHGKSIPSIQAFYALRDSEYETTVHMEEMTQLNLNLRFKEGHLLLSRVSMELTIRRTQSAFRHWVQVTKEENNPKMLRDRYRWRLHAAANQDIDLQAWYHALFYQEVC